MSTAGSIQRAGGRILERRGEMVNGQARQFQGLRRTWRNEANLRRKWLSRHGGWRFENWCFGGRFDGRCGGRGGLEVLESFESTEKHAVGAIDAAVEAGEGLEGVLVGMAERGIVLDLGVEELSAGKILVEAFDLIIPELGFDAAEAALDPLGGDEGVDKGEFGGAGWLVVVQVCGGEGFEFGGIFAGDDVGPGVDAGFQGVEGGAGLAFGGFGAGGFLGV